MGTILFVNSISLYNLDFAKTTIFFHRSNNVIASIPLSKKSSVIVHLQPFVLLLFFVFWFGCIRKITVALCTTTCEVGGGEKVCWISNWGSCKKSLFSWIQVFTNILIREKNNKGDDDFRIDFFSEGDCDSPGFHTRQFSVMFGLTSSLGFISWDHHHHNHHHHHPPESSFIKSEIPSDRSVGTKIQFTSTVADFAVLLK